MVETIEEFMEEIRAIRGEMQEKGSMADNMMLASWLDRLLLSLEKVSPTLALMAIELEELSLTETPEPFPISDVGTTRAKIAKKSAKKPAKRAKKKAKKKK